jgi:GNAT superfamily N-acetyltransferase
VTAIELTEEPYDGPVATALVKALNAEVNERYADEDQFTDEEAAAEDARYLAEVTPELVVAPHGVFLVAWSAGEPVGCGAVKPTGQSGVGEVKRMYVAPTARRRGVSRRLLAGLEARAAELGYERLLLETGAPQPEAIALYDSAGWHRIVPYGRWKDSPSSVCFAKDLAGPAPA